MSTTYEKPVIETNHSNTPTILFLIVALLLYGWGFFSTILFFIDAKNQPLIDEISAGITITLGLSVGLAPFILLFLILFIPLMIVLSYLLVKMIAKFAQEVTIIVSVLFPIILIGVGILIFTLSTESFMIALIIGGIGAILLLIVIWKFQSLKRAGKFVEFSAQLVLDEKAVLWMPILLGLFTMFSGFFLLFGFAEINSLFMESTPEGDQLSAPGMILAFLFSYFYLIIYFGIYYSLNAGVISYALDWYRGLDPDINSAAKDVRQMLPIILTFAFATATIKMIMQLVMSAGRQSGTRSGRGGNQTASLVFVAISGFIISIIGAIWQFINYFTLVAIIENKQGLKDSIKDSAKTRWNSFLDVLVGDTGFGLAMFIFFVINSLIWFVVGFGLGFIIFPNGVAGLSWTVFAIIFGIVFIFLGSFPYNIVTAPMRIAFTSFLYAYAKDSLEGFQKPSKLPMELTNEFKQLQKARDKRKMRDPTQYF
ncbi:MAG: hypothetical protein HeimC3_52090 [Candidatus Heimdallarchaeota archaeon LC_3]|nr:MAG: hypothetical protein HeimC3_52090 [Candidatus Heimdallarchaeota archaeon LC_3]